MWNTSAADGGAGYITSNTTSGFGESPTSATQGQAEQSRRASNLVPISVRGIISGLQADDVVRIGAEKVSMVIIVGIITSVDVQSTVVTFKIDDTTGPSLEVKQWLDQQGPRQKDLAELMKPLVENCYVKVTGSVRTSSGEVFLVAHNITSLSHLNELTCHLLEVAVVKRMLEQGVKASKSLVGGGFTQGAGISNQTSFTAPKGPALVHASFGGGCDTISGLTPQQQMVFQAIRCNNDEDGCSVGFLMTNVKGMSEDMIRKTVTLLSEEGHIYSTVDDDHFKATDN